MIAILRGLLIGAVGGTLCWLTGVPAPWLAGSMMAAIAAIFAGVKIGMPDWLKATSFILLGIQTGTTVSWETVDRAAHWPLSIALLAMTVVAVTWTCALFYTRFRNWDGETALFASLPGALSLVVLLASETGADMRRVTIAQCIRLFFLIAALPFFITQMSRGSVLGPVQQQIDGVFEIGFLVVLATAAGLLLERLKVPAGLILGPVLVGVALELTGIVKGQAPMILLIPANIVLGVMIAARFQGFSFKAFRESLGEGFAGFLIALAVAATGAFIASKLTGLPFVLTLLAFSPGGLDAMTIMAFALNLDPAYVGAHQIARYVGMALTIPWLTGLVLRHLERRGVPTGAWPVGVEED